MLTEVVTRLDFAAAHSYRHLELENGESRSLFGTGAHTRAHGHNYLLEVSLSGESKDASGRIIDTRDFRRIVTEEIDERLDHKHLNLDVPELTGLPPTLETVTSYIRTRMLARLPRGLLSWIRLYEHAGFWLELNEKDPTEYLMTRVYPFSAAHRLHTESLSDEENREIYGRCNNFHGHGHNYSIEVTLSGVPEERTGCLINVDEMDRIVGERVLTDFDHRFLNFETREFSSLVPTAENIIRAVWDRLSTQFGDPELKSLRLWETPRNIFEYHGP